MSVAEAVGRPNSALGNAVHVSTNAVGNLLPTPASKVGGVLVVMLGLVALLAPLIGPHDPEAIVGNKVLTGPSAAYLLGTDDLGRDVLSRLLLAYRVSLLVSIGSVVLAFCAGGLIGLVAGYFAGWVDTALMRAFDLLLAFPTMLLALSLIAIVGPGTFPTLLAIAVIYSPLFARVTRSTALGVRNQPYVDASRSRGASHIRLIFTHVLPNSVGPPLVQAAVLAGIALQIEAGLSYLGLGSRPPTPSLGNMLAEGQDYLALAPWLEISPGVAIAITVLAFNLVGDGLRRRFDPRHVTR